MLNFGKKVLHLRCDSHTSFKVKRPNVRVTRPNNADTHRAPYLPNAKAYELQTWCTDGGRRPALATGAMTSKVKGQGRKVTWSVRAVLAQYCTCVIRGERSHTVSAEPGGHTSCLLRNRACGTKKKMRECTTEKTVNQLLDFKKNYNVTISRVYG